MQKDAPWFTKESREHDGDQNGNRERWLAKSNRRQAQNPENTGHDTHQPVVEPSKKWIKAKQA
jgi:hypothetical protein